MILELKKRKSVAASTFSPFICHEVMGVKVGSQETPGVTGKFGFGIRNEAGQRLIEFCQENALVIHPLPTTQEKTLESPLDSRDIKPVNPKGNQP